MKNKDTNIDIWKEPDYKGMIPKLEEARIEFEQLRYAIKEGGLQLTKPIKRYGTEAETVEVTEKEQRAIQGILIQEGNKRLQEISDIKSYLEAVEKEGMIKVKSGYISNLVLDGSNFVYAWSPSGIKVDSFLMKGIRLDGELIPLAEHEEIADGMIMSIDFKEIREILNSGKEV